MVDTYTADPTVINLRVVKKWGVVMGAYMGWVLAQQNTVLVTLE